MRRLTPKQLERLRGIAVASLDAPASDRPDLGIAPEDLLVACDAALGADAREDEEDEEDEEERRALVETYHQRCAEAWRRRRGAQVGPTHAEWLGGPGCVQFSASVLSGRGGSRRRASFELLPAEIHRASERLRDELGTTAVPYLAAVRQGERRQKVQVHVPREMLLGIADALAGAVDAADAGHRFYHWESPETPRPCSTCRETRDAHDARIDAAHTYRKKIEGLTSKLSQKAKDEIRIARDVRRDRAAAHLECAVRRQAVPGGDDAGHYGGQGRGRSLRDGRCPRRGPGVDRRGSIAVATAQRHLR